MAAAKLRAIWCNEGRHKEAEFLLLLLEYLQLLRAAPGPKDPRRVFPMIKLQAQYDEADCGYILCIEARKLELNHEDSLKLFNVVWTMQELVDRLYKHGHHERAQSMEIEILELKLSCCNEESPQRSQIMEHLADKCHEYGRYIQAESMQLVLLDCRRETLGQRHTVTLRTMDVMANWWYERQQYEKAEVLERRAKLLQEEARDISTILSMHDFAHKD